MTTGAIIFMVLSWAFVLGLTFWSFKRMLSVDKVEIPEELGTEPVRAEGAEQG